MGSPLFEADRDLIASLPDRPIPLIEVVDTSSGGLKVQVNTEAMDVLKNLRASVCPVAVAGTSTHCDSQAAAVKK